MKNSIYLSLIASLVAFKLHAYGPTGHTMVGDIAQGLLQGKPAEAKLGTLLDGMTLGEVAVLPDEIKGWDQTSPSDPDAFHLPAHPKIESQLVAFWDANNEVSPSGEALHREFHFTDMPVKDVETYSSGQAGRSGVDLIHMINVCVSVLQGKTSENNHFKITKPVAVVLLAHYLGDIHQPLHVGAEYFSAQGNIVNPDQGESGFPDKGGNSLSIDINGVDPGSGRFAKNLHGFWDNDSVVEALRIVKKQISGSDSSRVAHADVVHFFVTHEPKWKLTGTATSGLAEAWANESQALSVEAHNRLEFVNMRTSTFRGVTTEKGTAKEKQNGVAYLQWAGQTVTNQLGKAGWRLANLLEEVLK